MARPARPEPATVFLGLEVSGLDAARIDEVLARPEFTGWTREQWCYEIIQTALRYYVGDRPGASPRQQPSSRQPASRQPASRQASSRQASPPPPPPPSPPPGAPAPRRRPPAAGARAVRFLRRRAGTSAGLPASGGRPGLPAGHLRGVRRHLVGLTAQCRSCAPPPTDAAAGACSWVTFSG